MHGEPVVAAFFNRRSIHGILRISSRICGLAAAHPSGAARTRVMNKALAALKNFFPLLLVCLFSVSAIGQGGAQSAGSAPSADGQPASHRMLYVATPGI